MEHQPRSSGKYITVNGVTLHYLDFGNSDKPPLLFIHGLTGNAHHFDAVVAPFISNYHVMALDVRGRGESGWGPPADYQIAVYVDDLATMLEQMAIDRVSLAGTSMGGIISMLYASAHPRRVERLVLNDIGPQVELTGIQRIISWLGEAPQEFTNLDEVAAYYRRYYIQFASKSDAEVAEWAKWAVRPTYRGTLAWKLDPAVRVDITREPINRTINMWLPYARIDMPTLVIRGALSDIISRETVTRMCRLSRRTSSIEVPGVGHAPLLTEPAAQAALLEFLTPQ